ncbi:MULTISPECIES: hypothetical protein [Actinoplanes]|uniref:hypothetical protein n=1 Tax=Actinoplanes TaxID=1865 RepID=UPI0005F2B0D0|nr:MULTISPECIES: hypothetical protein [Actinoplanes]GLY00009.1 hypothetical protein Acsp01_03880 [Actinoplanes sp. NBRC 101535]
MLWTWMALATVAIVTVVLGGLAFVAARQRVDTAPPGTEIPGTENTGEEVPLEEEARAVRAAAERAASAADEARTRAEYAVSTHDDAEQRYLRARQEAAVASGDEAQRLVQRAALEAYRRGDLSVSQLNGIWQHTGAPSAPVAVDDEPVRAARADYDEAVRRTADVRREAHVAAVAAEVLAEEARIVEQDALAAREAAAARSDLDDLFGDKQ